MKVPTLLLSVILNVEQIVSAVSYTHLSCRYLYFMSFNKGTYFPYSRNNPSRCSNGCVTVVCTNVHSLHCTEGRDQNLLFVSIHTSIRFLMLQTCLNRALNNFVLVNIHHRFQN